MDDRNISRDEQRERIRQRIQHSNSEGKQRLVIPAEETKSLTNDGVEKRVCAYCRVSTDDPAQTTSYELQKKHYEEQINSTPGWIYAGIYADEGISATSLKNRDEFNRMIADCYNGKIDVIVTKNVSRFARNVVDCLSVVRMLSQLNPPVGVKFETEGFFSLDNTSEMILTVLAAAAQEESKQKSNSMNWSLEKRFDNGNFLTPVLLGYDHDEDGNLIVNPDEAITVKMMYYSYLAGFPLTEIADLLMELNRPTKKGNIKWTASSVRAILQNERYCGNVLSWKTYTYNFWEHKKRKNKKNRKQVLEIDHHEGIVSHEIFDAVQAKLEMDKWVKERHPYPTLDVVDSGALKGFVSVNRICRGFTVEDYREASRSAYDDVRSDENEPDFDKHILSDEDERVPSSHFNLDGYEIARTQFFSTAEKPKMTIGRKKLSFNTICLKKFKDVEYVELLINTVEKCLAIRPCSENSPNAIRWGRKKDDRWVAITRSIAGFAAPLIAITGWDMENRYRLCGQYLSDGETQMLLFDLSEPEIFQLIEKDPADTETAADSGEKRVADNDIVADEDVVPEEEVISVVGEETLYPEEWKIRFGENFRERAASYFERIRYQGDWEILRPARVYSTAGGISQAILSKVEVETQKMIEEMRCAV